MQRVVVGNLVADGEELRRAPIRFGGEGKRERENEESESRVPHGPPPSGLAIV